MNTLDFNSLKADLDRLYRIPEYLKKVEAMAFLCGVPAGAHKSVAASVARVQAKPQTPRVPVFKSSTSEFKAPVTPSASPSTGPLVSGSRRKVEPMRFGKHRKHRKPLQAFRVYTDQMFALQVGERVKLENTGYTRSVFNQRTEQFVERGAGRGRVYAIIPTTTEGSYVVERKS